MRTLLADIGALYTCDRQDRILKGAYIVVEDERIAAVGEGVPEGHFDQRFSLAGCIVTPGFVNLHHHFFQTLTRAIPLALSGHLVDWLRAMYPLWAGVTPEDLGTATQASMAGLMLTGATTTVDHSYLMPGTGAEYADAQVAAAQVAGMRLHLVRGCMTSMEANLQSELSELLGPRAGGLVDEPKAVLADMRRVLAEHHRPGWGSRCTVALGSTAVPYTDIPFMREMAGLAREARTGLHVHFHPRPDERAAALDLYGTSPLEVLERMDWLRPGTWFAHSTRVDAEDMRRMAGAGVAVAHCPRMILRLGARVTPVHEMLAAGVPVGFGVDGGASNDSGSMLGELRLGLLMHRLTGGEGTVAWQQWLSPYQALCMATRGAAAILQRDDIGRIEAGACADIVGFDMSGIGFAGARTDWLSGLLLAGDDTRTAMTMIGGGIRVLGGKLLWTDEQRLGARTDAVTERLIARATGQTGLDYTRLAPIPA